MVNEIIFKKAVCGDKESFYELIEPIKDILYKIAFTYVENENDALDCVHDSILKAIKYLHNLKEPQYFNTWITRITINTCKDFIKRNNKVILVDINDYESKLMINENRSDDIREIELAINKLTQEEKELIVMRYLEDMSLKDISFKYEVPLGTIKSRLNRTLKKLNYYGGGIVMKNINIDNIKVSSRLDNVINSAITEGYEKKKNRRCKNNIAVAVIAIIMGTVIIKPDFVSAAISKFKNTIESFSSNENSYLIPEEYKTAIGKTIEDKNIKVTLNEFYIDKNLIVFTTTLDSRERSDYAQGMNIEIYIDGQLLEYTSSTGGYIHNDDGTVDILTTIYDEGLVINPNSNIVIKFNDIEVTNIFDFDKKITGNWQYNFTISSEDFTDKIITKTLNETLAVNDINMSINEITISPNIIRLNTELNNDVRFVIKDDKGNEYEPSSGFGVRENTIDYIYQINTKEVSSLTLIPKVNYNNNETSVLEYDKSIKLDIK